MESYRKALELDENDVSAYYNRGRILAYLGRYKEALKDFTNAINLEKYDERLLYERAGIFYLMKRYKDALLVTKHL